MTRSVLTPELVDRLVAEYDPDNGVSCVDLSKRHGISDSTVQKALKSQGVAIRLGNLGKFVTPPKVYTPEFVAQLVEEYDPDNGVTTAELGRRHGVSRSGVSKALREAGVEVKWVAVARYGPRPERWIQPEMEAEVVRLYVEEFKSATEIAELLPINKGTVPHVIRRNGHRVRPRSWGMRNRHLPQAEVQRVVDAIQSGMSVRQAADALDLSRGAVYHRIKVAGLQMPSRPRITHREVLRARFLRLRKGMTYPEIAREMGLSVRQVQNRVAKSPNDPKLAR